MSQEVFPPQKEKEKKKKHKKKALCSPPAPCLDQDLRITLTLAAFIKESPPFPSCCGQDSRLSKLQKEAIGLLLLSSCGS